MSIDDRISRFEQLTQDDPENDMAFFSLGGAYNAAARYEEAAGAYRRAVEIAPSFSKAYQLGGAAMMAAQRTDEAAEFLRAGYVVAAEQGDLMPKKAIAELLGQLGEELPEVEDKPATPAASEGDMVDTRTGRRGTKLPRPPFRGPLGAWIQEHVTAERWQEWIGLGTKVINELRLDLSNDEHDAAYDYAMRGFIGLSDTMYKELTGRDAPQPSGEFRGVLDQILSSQGNLEEYGGEMYRNV